MAYGQAISPRYGRGHGNEITAAIHQRGYELLRAGLQEKHCRTELGLTAIQWRWLKNTGNEDFPSYESMVIREVAAIRTEARNGAMMMSKEGIEAIRLKVENARAANAINQGILREMAANIMDVHSLRKQRGASRERGVPATIDEINAVIPTLETCMPSKKILECMKVLTKIGELNTTAEAFMRIYGDVPMNKALYPERDRPKPEDEAGQPLVVLQGDEAERAAFLEPDAMNEIVDGLRDMTEEQLRKFADGGDEVINQPGSEPEPSGE